MEGNFKDSGRRNSSISDALRISIYSSAFEDDSEKGRFTFEGGGNLKGKSNFLINPNSAMICTFPIANTLSGSNGFVISEDEQRIFRNVGIISLTFTLLFTAFQSMANLQSSINRGVKTR